jgi:hypothetical protein
MSTHSTSDEIRQVEETLHGILRHELASRCAEFCDAGLRVVLDPISRSGKGSNYVSFIEATVRYPDNDVHDVIFFYVAREGHLVVDAAVMPREIGEVVDESLGKASKDRLA